jgi:hypothetical protein
MSRRAANRHLLTAIGAFQPRRSPGETILLSSLLYGEGPGKIDRLLCPNSWRESQLEYPGYINKAQCTIFPIFKERKMNYSSLALAALAATVAYFAFGFLMFWLAPALIDEARKYPDVFRPKEKMMAVMPIGMVATLIAIVVVAIIFAMIHQSGSGIAEGARLGVLIGIFVVCGFVLHNYVNLNIGLKLALGQAVAYFVQWMIVGMVIGLIYKPVAMP